MCGLTAIFGNHPANGEERRRITAAMTERIAHRGPDGDGIHEGRWFTLGHRRLAVIDIAGGAQPMRSECGRYVLCFNGEIYNYRELRRRLMSRGVRFRTQSDTEVLLQLLVHDGEEALHELNGMFAFVFVDEQARRWLMARDPFGIKPLYYAAIDDGLAAASEIKALLAHPAVRADVNWPAMQEYLTFQLCLGDKTLFRDVRKLEPGCYLKGSGGRIDQHVRYWAPSYRVDTEHTESHFKDRLRSLLGDAVRLQLRSDVPVGTYLSGGLDSSLVTLLAAEHLHGPLKSFHGWFAEGPEFDESDFARLAAGEAKAELLTVCPTAEDFVEDLPRLVEMLDEPVAGPGVFPQYRVSKLAAQHVKVVLGGQGGDEIFGGYARYLLGYLEQALKGAILETQEEGQHVVTLASIIPNLPLLRGYRSLMQQFWQEGLFEDMDRRYFRLVDRSPHIESLLTDDAASALDGEDLFERFRDVFHGARTQSYLNRMLHYDFQTLLPALLQIEDRVSMAVSLESRVPLLDRRIVELVNSMPPAMKFQGGRTKHILKSAVSDFVPKAILDRKDKMGFPVPLHAWCAQGVVRDFVHDTLLSRAGRERGLFAPRAIEKLLESESPFSRQLWGPLCIELWHRAYCDGCSYRESATRPLSIVPSARRLAS